MIKSFLKWTKRDAIHHQKSIRSQELKISTFKFDFQSNLGLRLYDLRVRDSYYELDEFFRIGKQML